MKPGLLMIKLEISDSALLELYDVLQERRSVRGVSTEMIQFTFSVRDLINKSVEDANGLQQQALRAAYDRWERLNKERISALEKRDAETASQVNDASNDHEAAERKARVAEDVLRIEHDEMSKMSKDNDFFYPKNRKRSGDRRGPPPAKAQGQNKKIAGKW